MTGEIPYESDIAAGAARDCYEKIKDRAGKDPLCWGPIFNQGGTLNYNIAHYKDDDCYVHVSSDANVEVFVRILGKNNSERCKVMKPGEGHEFQFKKGKNQVLTAIFTAMGTGQVYGEIWH